MNPTKSKSLSSAKIHDSAPMPLRSPALSEPAEIVELFRRTFCSALHLKSCSLGRISDWETIDLIRRGQTGKGMVSGFAHVPVLRLSKWAEPGAKLASQQLGRFHRRKVASAWHFFPPLDIEKPCCPFARRPTDVLWEERKTGRDL